MSRNEPTKPRFPIGPRKSQAELDWEAARKIARDKSPHEWSVAPKCTVPQDAGPTLHAGDKVDPDRIEGGMPTVIRWMRDGLLPLSEELNGDERLEICEGDVYAELLAPGHGAYDLLLIDVDHSPTEPLDPASEPFYTWQGQRQVIDHLAPNGVLAVWSSGDDHDFAAVLDEVYPEATRERVRWINELIDDEEIEEVLFLARRG